jgi:hypothetical protein
MLIRIYATAVMSPAAEKEYAASALHTIEKINSCLPAIFQKRQKRPMIAA